MRGKMTVKSTNRQPNWNIYEAVILLDGYLEVLQNELPRRQIVKRISGELRQMAVTQGSVIDDVYRNEAGISYQMQSIESAYEGRKIHVPASRLFEETVTIYRADRKRYDKLLNEARSMIAARRSHKEGFLKWASSNLPTKRSKWIEENILKIERFANEAKLISGSIFDITSISMLETILRTTEKSKIFQIKNRRLIKNITEDFQCYIQFCSQLQTSNELIPEDEFVAQHGAKVRGGTAKNASVQEAPFYLYLHDTVKLADKTCASYISSIKSAERYAKSHGYKFCNLFDDCRETIVATAAELYGDPDFVKYNEEQHNRFSAAINKLMEFIGADIPRKALASVGVDLDGQGGQLSEANCEIMKVLKKHYAYGFKCDSIRELMRFRQFAEAMDISIPEDDAQLKTAIFSAGTVIDGKVYCKSDDLQQELRSIADEAFSSGAKVIYYECLFLEQSEWMSAHTITSEDMLKEYLQKCIPNCSFSKKFMVNGPKCSEKEIVTEEIKRVWGVAQTESVNDLSDRLPYIPLNNIWRVISGNDIFVFVSEGVYLFLDRFHITGDETEDILDYVEVACEENGFASLSNVPLGDIEEENYELTQSAIYHSIYKKVLTGKYYLNGKILTKNKPELNVIALLKQYIKDRDECTLDELADKVVELTGSANRQYAFQALYDDMVRVDSNRFVANKFVRFNVDEIDKILSGFIIDHFRAIKDVTTFAMFPFCGQSWNHYLLESYCYKYSKKYSLHVICFNDKNAGIIAERDFNKQYNEMISMALARTDLELIPEVIGPYLSKAGYVAKSKYAKLGEIAQQAERLRKEG